MKDHSIDKAFRFDFGLEDIINGEESSRLPTAKMPLQENYENAGGILDHHWQADSLERFILNSMTPP